MDGDDLEVALCTAQQVTITGLYAAILLTLGGAPLAAVAVNGACLVTVVGLHAEAARRAGRMKRD